MTSINNEKNLRLSFVIKKNLKTHNARVRIKPSDDHL